MKPSAQLTRVLLPTIGRPTEPRPEVPPAVFAARLERVRTRLAATGLDALVIYGDREHFANLAWLTNYDPRFEEALLVVPPTGKPVLFVGNEGWGYSQLARLDLDRRLYQTFSLLGQPREQVRPLATLLREAGLARGARVGVAGWKYFTPAEFANADELLDAPEFVAHSIREAVGTGGRVTNAGALFMAPEDGLRSVLEPEQIADFEWIATHNSASVLAVLRALRPGLTELAAFANMECLGLPFGYYPSVVGGDRFRGSMMASPSSRVIERGEPMIVSCGYQGANTCRVGWVATVASELPANAQDYVATTAAPYAAALGAWYGTLRLGATGDQLHHAVWDRLAPLGFTLGLNIGHQIAADEWTHSLVHAGSTQTVRSGMYWQADFFAARPSPHYGAYAEDGVVVADAALRATLAKRYPLAWSRWQARRRFMTEQLGFAIGDELLPMSNCAGAVIPFLQAPEQCLTVARQERA